MGEMEALLKNFTEEQLEQLTSLLNSRSEEDATDEMENMYLNFTVGNETYGIEIRYVLQIVGMQPISAMPDMEPSMKGYITLRGNVIPIISLRLHFGLMEEEYTDRTCIVVIKIEDREIGLIVDTIEETITIEEQNISPPPATDGKNTNPTVQGIAQLGNGRTAVLLHAQKLFAGAASYFA